MNRIHWQSLWHIILHSGLRFLYYCSMILIQFYSVLTTRQSNIIRENPVFISYKVGSTWRLPRYNGTAAAIWPNYTPHLTHPKHKRQQHWHTWGVMKQTRMNVVDNSVIGRKAMAEGKPPRVIHVYARKHQKKAHGTIGKLGDRVMVAILGRVNQGIFRSFDCLTIICFISSFL